GDFQQSIYRDPADLARYRELHEVLAATNAAQELKFSVTFRLDTTQRNFVNATFGEILNNQEGQVAFVELHTCADVLPGQVVRFDFGFDVDLALPESELAVLEARELAAWLHNIGHQKLRAESWRQVAILCPRKAWLRTLRGALTNVDLPVEVHSESDREGENPAYAWLTALLTIMVDPDASYEARGLSLSDLGQILRTQFHATRETHPSQRDAIQLITAHKAKGSEWQAVIVPFLTREIHDTHPAYPYAIRNVNAPGAKIIL